MSCAPNAKLLSHPVGHVATEFAALKADPAIAHYGWELPPIAAAAANPFDIRPKWATSPADRTTPVSDMLFDNRGPPARQHHQRRFFARAT